MRFSSQEHSLLNQIMPEEAELTFPTEERTLPTGEKELEYIFPDISAKMEVVRKLYPFAHKLADSYYDLHSEKKFRTQDCHVIRTCGRNMLVAEDYFQTGGMVIDWCAPEEVEREGGRIKMQLK